MDPEQQKTKACVITWDRTKLYEGKNALMLYLDNTGASTVIVPKTSILWTRILKEGQFSFKITKEDLKLLEPPLGVVFWDPLKILPFCDNCIAFAYDV